MGGMDEFANGSVSFSPDGQRIASGTSARVLRLADASTGKELASRELPAGIFSVAFSPDGRSIAVAGRVVGGNLERNGYLAVHDPTTCDALREFPAEETVTSAAYSLDGHKLAAVEGLGSLVVIDLATGTSSSMSTDGSATAFLANDAVIALERDGIRLLRASGETVASFPCRDAAFNVFASRSREVFAIDTRHQTFCVMDMRGMKLGEVAFKTPTPGMALSGDGSRIAFATRDRLRLVEVATGRVLWNHKTTRSAFALDVAPDGGSLVWADAKGHMTIERLPP